MAHMTARLISGLHDVTPFLGYSRVPTVYFSVASGFWGGTLSYPVHKVQKPKAHTLRPIEQREKKG